MADLKKVKNILHLVIWICSVVAAGLIADIGCFGCRRSYMENQFVDAIILGQVFITTILFAMIFFEEEVPEKTFYLLTIGGAVVYLGAGIIVVFNRDDTYYTTRSLCSGILACVVGAIFLFEFIASLTKKEMLE